MADVGKIFPAEQSGTATLSAGSVVVTYAKPFKKIPNVVLTLLTAGTTQLSVQAPAAAIGLGTLVITSVESLGSLSGGTTPIVSGVTAVPVVAWRAYVDN